MSSSRRKEAPTYRYCLGPPIQLEPPDTSAATLWSSLSSPTFNHTPPIQRGISSFGKPRVSVLGFLDLRGSAGGGGFLGSGGRWFVGRRGGSGQETGQIIVEQV